jgi:cell division protein FtsB
MSVPRRLRPLAVVAYAAFVGLLLASYITPLQDILQAKSDISALEQKIQSAETHNTTQKRLVKDLNTPAGIEKAARERYGMVKPGEKVYIIPPEGEE